MEPEAPVEPTPPPTRRLLPRGLYQGKFFPAFWTVSGVISITVNVVLIVILYFLGQELFTLKQVISDQLIGGLYTNFVKMEQAVIETTILVEDTIPVQFTLPLNQTTNVILAEDTFIPGAQVVLATGGVYINAPADITLRKGTVLPAALALEVPVDTEIPISIQVPVSIPLDQTQLDEPFVGLQEVVLPYSTLLSETPNSWQEAFCANPGLLCFLFGGR